jgi:hypothetical protein
LGLYYQIRDDYCMLRLQQVMSELWFLDSWVCSCASACCHECVGVLLWYPTNCRSCLYVGVRCRAERSVNYVHGENSISVWDFMSYVTVFHLLDFYFLLIQVITFWDLITCSCYECVRFYAICTFMPWW